MAIIDYDNLIGELEITERPANLAYGKPWDFVNALCRILKVNFPVHKQSKFTLVGFEVPGPDDTDKVWARTDRNLNPLGWYAFVKNQWRKLYTPVLGEIRWVSGDSANPPDGWEVVDTGSSAVPLAVVNQLKTLYVIHPSSPGGGRYLYYAVRYVGY